MIRKDSGLTVTDQFCGAGGSTIGAKRAGLIVLEAQNHWKRAIDTYSANHQNTRVHHADVSNTDPRKLASTDLLITSPECTTHSPAGGSRRNVIPQRDMFQPDVDDPKFERSRATMQDVIRYAEYHRYEGIIVENVVEVTRWELFVWWLNGMKLLGYDFKIVCFNSMFAWPTPQSRDRVYLIFWRTGNRAPNLEITPLARCHACERHVQSVQTWKAAALARASSTWNQPIGKYGKQYVYTCPSCARVVSPYYYAAMNAIDFSVPGRLIGDRLKPRTRARIAYGIQKYAHRSLLISSMDGNRLESRVRDANERALFTQSSANQTGLATPFVVKLKGGESSHVKQSASGLGDELPTLVANSKTAALVTPGAVAMLINTRNGSRLGCRVRDACAEPIATQTRGLDHGLAMSPLLVETNHPQKTGDETRVSSASTDPLTSRTTKIGDGLLTSPGFVVPAGSNDGKAIDMAGDVVPTLTKTDRLGVAFGVSVTGSALISLRDSNAMWAGGMDDALRTQLTDQQAAVFGVDRVPFVVEYANAARSIDQPLTVQASHAQKGVADGDSASVNEYYFRMLLDYEIGRGMAFPDDYVVTGNSGERVKQFGNAVTPPVMDILSARLAASLAPELDQ